MVASIENNIDIAPMNLTLAAGDIDGDGRLDIVISGRNGRMVWLENNGTARAWVEHVIDDSVHDLERGGILYDLTGSGLPDIINGGDWRSDEIWWWENPGRADARWKKRLIARTGKCQIHDILVGDVTGAGVPSLLFTNQAGGADICRVELPRDVRSDAWPPIELIATGKSEPNPYAKSGRQPEEGLAIGDVDGDGKPELVCGTHWYKYDRGQWQGHRFAQGYITTLAAVGDLDGDGRNEIVLTESDPCAYGNMQGGRLSWFKPGRDVNALWEEHPIASGLLDPHSLKLADLFGNGRVDIFSGEAGTLGRGWFDRAFNAAERILGIPQRERKKYALRPPQLLMFENDGAGAFTRHVVDEGTGIHDGLLADLLNRGVADIVGKPLYGAEKWNVHVWFREPAQGAK